MRRVWKTPGQTSLFRSKDYRTMLYVDLYPHQKNAIDRIRTGSILCGGVGSGKSRAALAYFYRDVCGCRMSDERVISDEGVGYEFPNENDMARPTNLYIITTPKKRDSLEWHTELAAFHLYTASAGNPYAIEITIDSWNNVKKYVDVQDAFFIFDEQRAVGSGTWAKSFIAIARHNDWIMLSATPGDTWMDYCSVFIANGFYRNKTEFVRRHVIYNRFVKYPQVERYLETDVLERLRSKILINMEFKRDVIKHTKYVDVSYNEMFYDKTVKERWNPFKSAPAQDAGEMCRVLRRIVNSDPARVKQLKKIVEAKKKVIVFYNYNYERELIKRLAKAMGVRYAEWNGFSHNDVPKTENWIFAVQYTAGAEGWNCITTDTIVFFSQSYSYKAMVQAAGRIDRLNTPYENLYYYYLITKSSIDKAIKNALDHKKDFNVNGFMRASSNTMQPLFSLGA